MCNVIQPSSRAFFFVMLVSLINHIVHYYLILYSISSYIPAILIFYKLDYAIIMAKLKYAQFLHICPVTNYFKMLSQRCSGFISLSNEDAQVSQNAQSCKMISLFLILDMSIEFSITILSLNRAIAIADINVLD